MNSKKIDLKLEAFKKSFKNKMILVAVSLTLIYLVAPSITANASQRMSFLPLNSDIEEPSVAMQIRIIAKEKGFKFPNYLVDLAFCESRLDQFATNLNKGHSLDVGLFQWNMHYHPEVGMECALDIRCATEKTIEAINDGHQAWWICDKLI